MKKIVSKLMMLLIGGLLILSEVNVSFAQGGNHSLEKFSADNLEKEAKNVWPLIKIMAVMAIGVVSLLLITKGGIVPGLTGFVVMTIILMLTSKLIGN